MSKNTGKNPGKAPKKPLKTVLKAALCLLLVLIVAVGGYAAYVLIAYHRLGDMDLAVNGRAEGQAAVGTDMSVVTWNVGFGAYEPDYSFFMDGGTQSWAWSKERLDKNLLSIASRLEGLEADFALIQELDADATRTYHVDERAYLTAALKEDVYASSFALNYDSPFIMVPPLQPHGASKSGLMTFSAHGMTSAVRHELPVESSLMRLLDLDRCYSVSRVSVEDGRELVLYNLHLSAYTSDGTIATDQLTLLIEDMSREYATGNWCVAGGDFNKDLLGDSSAYFGVKPGEGAHWAQPFPAEMLRDTSLRLVAPLDEDNPVPTCRDCDTAYRPGQFVVVVDGFIVSDNVDVKRCAVAAEGFENSDHNPVIMTFALTDAPGASSAD